MSDEKSMTSNSSTNPAVSIIIPMYNAADYISECLDSLLAQTFQNFEVIIADDCSTDSSCEIIEKYMPKFDGRLKLTHTEKNSGGCAVPRNVGLPLARGEYVFFMDSDDALTKTGLEEMYTLAKEYDADVVYCERYYMSEGTGEGFIENMHVAKGRIQPPPYVEEPTLESEDLTERVDGILNDRFWFAAWLKLVRHDLLKEHKIFFPYVKPGEDDTWTHALIFFAKKFLRVPNMVYIRRMRDDSIMGKSKTPQQSINFWFNPILLGIKELDKVMSQIEFFQENPEQRYAVLERQVQGKLRAGLRYAGQLTPTDVYEAIKDEFGDKFGEYDTLISALCSHIFGQDKTLKETQKDLKRAESLAQEVEDSIAAKEFEMVSRVKSSISHLLDLRQNYPDISVVIPLYNAEKYIGELLDSLLAQTFPNFEVIVVDDCSTDKSVKIIEEYTPKFSGRLRFQKLEMNSGTGGSVPRNVGFKLVRGDYVLFVDADDYLTKSALETFYTAAKQYDADVVYTSAYNLLYRPNTTKVLRDGINQKLSEENIADEPTFTLNNPNKNLRKLDTERAFNFPWTHLVKRDLLARNQIEFPIIPNGVDHLWALQVYCYSNRFLRITDALYYYRRYQSDSISTIKRKPNEQVSYWTSTFALWLKALGEISDRIKILKNNPAYVLAAAQRHFDWCLDRTEEARKNLTDYDIYKILYNEFSKANVSSELTVPFFFSVIDAHQKGLRNRQEAFFKFKEYYTARIDIQLKTERAVSGFKLFSVSDEKAEISKPEWLQKGGVGYQIQSYAGQLSFVAKATADGQFTIQFRALDIRRLEDKFKRIPYWIDYTNLTINGKKIFDKSTPAWHDEPYIYNRTVKEGEEIKVEVKWLPHRSEATPSTKALVQSLEEQIPRKFMPFITSRMEIKLLSKEGDFKILSLSDNNARVTKPEYLQKGSTCYCIHSYSGKMEMVAKSSVAGQVRLLLRSMDIRDPKDNIKTIYWIDYTNLVVNGKTVFDTLTPIWYDKFFGYNIDVKANEEIKIQVEWQPHRSDTP